jgi:DNA topoisomerase-1
MRGATPLRVLGKHPADNAPVELFAGRYGPYVKHGGINATVQDRDKLDTLTLDEAVTLLAAKGGKAAPARKAPRVAPEARETAAPPAATKRAPPRRPSVATRAPAAAKKPVTVRTTSKSTAKKATAKSPATKTTRAASPVAKRTARSGSNARKR